MLRGAVGAVVALPVSVLMRVGMIVVVVVVMIVAMTVMVAMRGHGLRPPPEC